MPKTIKKQFYAKLTFDNFLKAHERAKKNKGNKKEIILYEMDLENNLINLIEEIKNGNYKIGKYREFKIYEPKMRIIKALPYKDRIVHQWYVEEFIKPMIAKKFIYDSYACIKDKGSHRAVLRLQFFMRQMKKKYNEYYIIKCDIKKYFYNIDRNILYDILKKYISDKKLLMFTKVLLETDEQLGIPIGNYTSQFFANIYLNELDHYIKEKLCIKYYLRYMDDFIILVKDKETAKYIMECVDKYVNKYLHLQLNSKSRYYPNKFGCNFCGYVIYETHILLRKRFKLKMKKKVKKWNQFYTNDVLDIKKTRLQWNSSLGHAIHSSSYNFMNKIYYNIICRDYIKKPSYKLKKVIKSVILIIM